MGTKKKQQLTFNGGDGFLLLFVYLFIVVIYYSENERPNRNSGSVTPFTRQRSKLTSMNILLQTLPHLAPPTRPVFGSLKLLPLFTPWFASRAAESHYTLRSERHLERRKTVTLCVV